MFDRIAENFTLGDALYLLVLIFAFLLSVILTPIIRAIAKKAGMVDKPDGIRKLHEQPVPIMGGLAITVAFCAATLAGSDILLADGITKRTLIIIIGSVYMCLVGLIDDRFDMPAMLKFALQIVGATATVFFGGVIEYISVFGYVIHFGVLAVPITVLWIVLVTNAVNLIDGLDGLACGVSSLASFALFVTSLFVMGDPTTAIIAAALCGSGLGFLPYNSHPASIFMGDAGALMFGYVLACTSVFGYFKGHTFFSIIVPALVLAVPILETVSSFFRRILSKKMPFAADRSHLHNKLVDMGFSHRGAVLLIYVATAGFCVSGVLFSHYKSEALIIAAFSLVFIGTLKLSANTSIRAKKRKKLNAVIKAAASASSPARLDAQKASDTDAVPYIKEGHDDINSRVAVLTAEPDTASRHI